MNLPRLAIILPGVLAGEGEHSLLRSEMPNLARLRDRASVFRLEPTHALGQFEAQALGFEPHEIAIAGGPLVVAALGYDPPERSVHYQLTLMCLQDGVIAEMPNSITDAEESAVLEAAKRLNTRRLTVCSGIAGYHGLVLESGSLNQSCRSPAEAAQAGLLEALPQGEEDVILRRFIDDSVNLLSEQEFNYRRMDLGLAPVNLLWPWDPGFRPIVPNLSLRIGEPLRAVTDSMRLRGLARLAGARISEFRVSGLGLRTDFNAWFDSMRQGGISIGLRDEFAELDAQGLFNEKCWLASKLDKAIERAVLSGYADKGFKLTLLLPASDPTCHGLGLTWQFDAHGEGNLPFDERSLGEGSLRSFTLSQAVRRGMVEGL